MPVGKTICYPFEFQNAFIREHPEYENDLKDILERSGFKEKFRGLYKQRLKFLEERKELCIQRRDWFERLKHVDGDLYAIKFKAQKNIRIIFCFIEYQEMKYAVLLYPFEEKESGKIRGSYITANPTALSRYRGLLDD
jgi:hypothetical protein